MDEFYDPDYGRGIRWNDSKFDMQWPAQPVVISERDENYRDFDPAWHLTY
jgi:dTDP-4-dehydrorhamnose 3,5-epimerase